MGVQIKVLQKGKITLPAEIRRRLGIKEGDILTLEVMGGRVVLLPPKTVLNPTQLLDGLAEGIRVTEPLDEELKRASAAMVNERFSRSRL